MDIEANLPRHPFVIFTQQLTQQPLIQQALHELQNENNMCASLLVYLIWVGVVGKGRVNQSQIKRLMSAVAPWHLAISKTLQDFATTIGNHVRTKSLLETVSPILMHAAQTEQEILAQTLLGLSFHARNRQQQLYDACNNIATYLQVLQVGLDEAALQAVNVILQAVFPENPALLIADALNQVLVPGQLLGNYYAQMELERL